MGLFLCFEIWKKGFDESVISANELLHLLTNSAVDDEELDKKIK